MVTGISIYIIQFLHNFARQNLNPLRYLRCRMTVVEVLSRLPQPDRRRDRRKWGANVTNSGKQAKMEQKYPLISVFIGNQGVYFVLARLDWQKKRQPCGCLLWWARRDLNLSYVNRFAQSIDRKSHFLSPTYRPFTDLTDENRSCKSYTSLSLGSAVIVTEKTSDRKVSFLAYIINQLADLLSRFSGRGRQHVAVNIHRGGNVFMA